MLWSESLAISKPEHALEWIARHTEAVARFGVDPSRHRAIARFGFDLALLLSAINFHSRHRSISRPWYRISNNRNASRVDVPTGDPRDARTRPAHDVVVAYRVEHSSTRVLRNHHTRTISRASIRRTTHPGALRFARLGAQRNSRVPGTSASRHRKQVSETPRPPRPRLRKAKATAAYRGLRIRSE